MAAGDLTVFNSFLEALGEGVNLETDAFKLALIKSAANGGDDPAATDAAAAWTGGTVNFGTAEVAEGGNYSANGAACDNAAYTVSSNVSKFDCDDPATWSQSAGNPTNARWAILYDDTTTPKHAVCFIDLGGDINMTSGDLDINFGSGGIFTITRS